MTIEEYQVYAPIADSMFRYLNGRVNTLNSNCNLYIDMYDLVNGTNGNINFPNNILIHIGTIIDSYKDEWRYIMDRHDYICTLIAWTLVHELMHADQLLSMIEYNNNPEYKSFIENNVENASYNWVLYNAEDLEYEFDFRVILDSIDPSDFENCNKYQKADAKEFYFQTIANIVLRDFDIFRKLSALHDEKLSTDLFINFNDVDRVAIKLNDKYVEENVNEFSNMVYKWTGRFDTYKVSAYQNFMHDEWSHHDIAEVKFIVEDALYKPMSFKKGM